MTRKMPQRRLRASNAAGFVLLEGLIAILIFSLGILAMVGMQAVAVTQIGDARYRSAASELANDLIGTMWVSDREAALLQTNFNTGGAGYATWMGKVADQLPGVAANPPTVVVAADGTTTVTIFWRTPNEHEDAAPRRHVAIAQIR